MTTSAPDAVGPVDVLIRTTGDRARRASLARAIESVLGQQGVEARAIVVVVGKQPNVESAVAPRSGVKVHLSGCSAAPGRALRIAVDLVEAPYFAFLDDDDELLPHAMATRLAVMHADPAVTVVVTSGNWITQGR